MHFWQEGRRRLDSLGLTKEQVRKSAKKDFADCMFEFQSDDWDDAPAFKNCLKACISGETDKQRRSVLVVASGMGDGKTRLLQELVGLAKEVPDLSKFNTVELRVNFENDTFLRNDELEGNVDVDKILLDRLLFCMLAPEGQMFDAFRRENQWGFTCETLVWEIQKMFKEKEKDAMVFFLVDGIHNLDRDRPDSDSANWKQNSIQRRMLDVMSIIIKSAAYRFVACSSTVTKPVQRAMANSPSVLRSMVSPPVLTRLPKEVTNKVVLEHKEQFLEMFGAHPRSMEVLVSNDGGTPAEVFEAAVDKLRDHYKIGDYLSAGQLRAVLKYSLGPHASDRSPVGDATLETFMQNGLLRICRGSLTVSPLYLMIELKHAIAKGDGSVTEHPLFGWQPFGHDHEGDFEKYVAWVRCLRSRVFEGEVTIERLHHGVQWVSPEPDIRISSTPLELCAAAHQVHTASKGKARTISDKKRMKKKRSEDWKVATSDAECVDPLQACIVNAKGAAAGDVFSSVKTSAGVRLNEVIQAKAWLGGKEELPTDEVLKNAKASASRGDLYLLATRNTVTDAALEQLQAAVCNGVHVGVVRNENFNEYYGPFAGTFLHETSMHILSFHLPVFSMSLPSSPHRTRGSACEQRPPLVDTALGHDACTSRRSPGVVVPAAPARCASQRGQPAAASPCSQGLLVDHRLISPTPPSPSKTTHLA